MARFGRGGTTGTTAARSSGPGSTLERFLRRYEIDTSRPRVADAAKDALRRALAPGLVVWALVVGVGLLIEGPMRSFPAEVAVNEELVAVREPTWNTVTSVLSNIGGTEFIVAVCATGFALLWWRTRQWWFSVVPGLAVALQALLFVTAALVVGRDRPDVEHLDASPPTSGFPSGHAGASTAFYLTLAFVAQRLRRPVQRRLVTALCVLVPLLVGFARLYRGMHHPSDVVLGLVNGGLCAVLAWLYLRRDTQLPWARRQTRA
jgi:undecaprenyl-diphosphatase